MKMAHELMIKLLLVATTWLFSIISYVRSTESLSQMFRIEVAMGSVHYKRMSTSSMFAGWTSMTTRF